MRVAVALGGSDRGRSGIGRYLHRVLPLLAAELERRGDELLALGTALDLEAYQAALPSCEHILLPPVCDEPGVSALWHLTLIGRQARQGGADVLLLPAANRRATFSASISTVAVVHDLAQLHVARKYDPLRMFYVRRVLVASLRTATRLVAVSRATRDDLVDLLGFPAERVCVVPNGVDVGAFRSEAELGRQVDDARAAVGVGGPYLLYPARLEHPGKNHLRLLEAFAGSPLSRSHHLVLVGADWGGEALIRGEIERLGLEARVRIAGFVSEETLVGLVAGAEAVLVLGLHEGFGLPALEALAAGRPVVASRTGAAMEAVGSLGVSCDPYDTASIRNALETVVSDPDLRRRAQSEGPAWAAGWSWERTAQGLLQACLEVAEGRTTVPAEELAGRGGAWAGHVDILGLRFPLLTREEALAELVRRIEEPRTTGVAFPDMSTMNLASRDPGFLRLLQRRFLTFNDGAGLAWAARRQGRRFPDNLNGTDLVPRLLAQVPQGTRVYLLGARPGVASRAMERFAARFPHVDFVGASAGYLDGEMEERLLEELRQLRPAVVLVAMGNPLQVRFIDRHLDDPGLQGTVWLAVGGLLDYHGGDLQRAPSWMRRSRLEWLFIVAQQPRKARRYLLGIPEFLSRCLVAEVRGTHRLPPEGRPPPRPGRLGSSNVKRVTKTTLRHLVGGVGRILPRAPASLPRILTYHGVCRNPEDEWSVTPAQLAAQMRILSEDFNLVSLDRIVAWVRGEEDLPPRSVAVTFDDGFRDVLDEAAPILAEAGVPGAIFVPTHAVVGRTLDPSYQPLRPFLRWDQVRELHECGWQIGSHALTHPQLSRLSDEAAREELRRSREELEQALGAEVSLLAYPYGTPGTVSARDRRFAAEVGYRAGFMAVTGPLHRGDDLFGLSRSKVLGTDSTFTFRATLQGALDAWSWVERTH